MTPCDAYKKWLESYEATLLDTNATLAFWLSMQYSNIAFFIVIPGEKPYKIFKDL